jgi:uncharacterized membrane protein
MFHYGPRRTRTPDVTEVTKKPRFQALDIARGVALLAMAVFHTGWDLYYFGVSPIDVTTHPGWVVFQKLILSSFLLLVGMGLVIATENGVRWRRFFRREAVLVAAALAVTAGTYWMFPEYFVFFGVLHAIALFSLLGLVVRRLPGPALLAIGALWVAASLIWSDPAFTERSLAWIGFWPISPATADIVPIFPWFGVVLLGMGALKLLRRLGWGQRLLAAESPEPALRGLAFIGRHSLAFYLVHQPVILALLYGLVQIEAMGVATTPEDIAFRFQQSCEATCIAAGTAAEQCTSFCGCALDQVRQSGNWALASAQNPDAAQRAELGQIAGLCHAMTDPR